MIRMFICLLLLPGSVLACEGTTLVVDVEESSVAFTVTQGDAPFSGDFESFGGELCSRDGQLESMRLWLAPGSVSAGLPEVNELLQGPEFFAIDDFPRVEFRSISVHQQGERVTVTGELTIKGITKEQSVEFLWLTEEGAHRAKGRFVLDRLAYGLGSGEWANTDYLSADVQVEFDAQLLNRP